MPRRKFVCCPLLRFFDDRSLSCVTREVLYIICSSCVGPLTSLLFPVDDSFVKKEIASGVDSDHELRFAHIQPLHPDDLHQSLQLVVGQSRWSVGDSFTMFRTLYLSLLPVLISLTYEPHLPPSARNKAPMFPRQRPL